MSSKLCACSGRLSKLPGAQLGQNACFQLFWQQIPIAWALLICNKIDRQIGHGRWRLESCWLSSHLRIRLCRIGINLQLLKPDESLEGTPLDAECLLLALLMGTWDCAVNLSQSTATALSAMSALLSQATLSITEAISSLLVLPPKIS